ncbi:MAG TPA: hypothetical protein VF645_01250 [Allosphingosinicella sp.]|jgi:hypothetical protein
MFRNVIACAAIAALGGCSSEKDAGTAEKDSTSAGASAKAPAAAAGQGSEAQLAAYRPYFDTLWKPGAAITPDEVRKKIEAEGATRAVEKLSSSHDPDAPLPWSTVTAGIARGEPQWLAVAPLIRPGTQAGSGDEYSMALTAALTTNPAGSLRLMALEEGGSGGYCIAADYETPPEQIRAYYAAAIANVERVGDPELQDIKAACLKQLREEAARPPA